METNHYDAVVCGPDMVGLLAANLIGRRGLRVLLVGHDQVPDLLTAGPYTIARAPDLIPSLERETVKRVFAELNQTPLLQRRSRRTRAALEVFVQDRCLELSVGEGTIATRLARAFPGESEMVAEVADRLLEIDRTVNPAFASDINLPPEGFWERREVARFESRVPHHVADPLHPLPTNHPARATISAIGALSARFAPADLGAVPLAHILHLASDGYQNLPGGIKAQRELLLDELQSASGEVRDRVTGFELVMRRNRVRGLRLRPRDEVVGLDHLVWAGPIARLASLIEEPVGRRVRELAMAVRPACYRYCLALLMRPAGVPETLAHRTVSILEPSRPSMEDNAILITVGAPLPRQDDLLPVWVECLVPAAVVGVDLSYLSVVRSRILEHLARRLTDPERTIVAAVSAHDGLPPLCPEQGLGGGPAPEEVADHRMPALLSCDLHRTLEVGALPHRTAIKNLHLGSNEILPGLGAEGDFIAAWNVARRVAGGPRRRRVRTGRAVLISD